MLRDLAYGLYSRKLRRELSGAMLPRHVALIMDGNRRWARQTGLASPSLGHKYGAEHVQDVLNWCERTGIRHVTVFVCSAENLQRRGDAEIAFLMQVIEDILAVRLARPPTTWQVHTAGTLDVLPGSTTRALKQAVEATRECATGAHVTLAIGYGGRQELVQARAFAPGGALQPAADDLGAGDQRGDLRQLPGGQIAEPADRVPVAGRRGQQGPDLVEGQARSLPGLDHREHAHGVRAVDAPSVHPARRRQQADLLVVADRGRPPARQRGDGADGHGAIRV